MKTLFLIFKYIPFLFQIVFQALQMNPMAFVSLQSCDHVRWESVMSDSNQKRNKRVGFAAQWIILRRWFECATNEVHLRNNIYIYICALWHTYQMSAQDSVLVYTLCVSSILFDQAEPRPSLIISSILLLVYNLSLSLSLHHSSSIHKHETGFPFFNFFYYISLLVALRPIDKEQLVKRDRKGRPIFRGRVFQERREREQYKKQKWEDGRTTKKKKNKRKREKENPESVRKCHWAGWGMDITLLLCWPLCTRRCVQNGRSKGV